MENPHIPNLEVLTAEGAWVRPLARALVRDESQT